MLRELAIAFGIMSVCVVLHVLGIVALTEWLLKKTAVKERITVMHTAVMLITTYSLILLLHAVDAVLWAVFYYIRELFPSFETSLYFSLTSYTTIGYGDVVLPERWRLLGAVEGISGVLLSGLSTALLFLILQYLLRLRKELKPKKHGKRTPKPPPPPIVPEPAPIAPATSPLA